MASRTLRSDAIAVVRHLSEAGAPALRAFIERQRWFAGKARGLRTVRIEDWSALSEDPLLVLLLIRADDTRYFVPVALGQAPADPARSIGPLGGLSLFDAHWHPDFGTSLLDAITSRRSLASACGTFRCGPVEPWDHASWDGLDRAPAAPHSGEQSNTSIFFDRRLILKSIRRPEPGINPDFEMLRFFAERPGFGHVPRLAGWAEYAGEGGTATVALLQQFVANTGDGWTHMLARLGGLCERLAASDDPAGVEGSVAALGGPTLAEVRQLGEVTGGLHAALASEPGQPDFRPEPITGEDVRRWSRDLVQDLERLTAEITVASERMPPAHRAALEAFLDARPRIERAADDLSPLADGAAHKIRCHGDYHLGQVLKTADSFVVIDFEGEPARSVDERRAKQCPLRDVAGMLRSFDYVVEAALAALPEVGRARLRPALEAWERLAAGAFLSGYRMAAAKSPERLLPRSPEAVRRACAAFELEKACYELRYELNNRPDWIAIPLAGIWRLLG